MIRLDTKPTVDGAQDELVDGLGAMLDDLAWTPIRREDVMADVARRRKLRAVGFSLAATPVIAIYAMLRLLRRR